MHLKKWSAKRSGAGIRVTGFDTESQKDAKVQCGRHLTPPRRPGSSPRTRMGMSTSSPTNSQHFDKVPVCHACRDRKWHRDWCGTCRADTATTRVPRMTE
jgi:hypothetical protein